MWIKSSFCRTGNCVEVEYRKSSCCTRGDCVEVGFVTSSFCGHPGCVAVAVGPEEILVRDSKDADGPVLRFTREEWEAFKAGVLAGEF
jgi:hypothetical protein